MSEEFKNPAKQNEFNQVIILLINEIFNELQNFIPKEKKTRLNFYIRTLSEMNRGIKYREEGKPENAGN